MYRHPPGGVSYAYVTNGAEWWGEICLPPRYWLNYDADPILLQRHEAPFVAAINLRSADPLEVAATAQEDTEYVGPGRTSQDPKDRTLGWPTSPKNTVPADKNGPHPSPPEYRTVQQIDTVLSDKNCRAVRQIRPSSWGQPALFETIVDESPAKAEIFGSVGTRKKIAYSPTSITVLPNKE